MMRGRMPYETGRAGDAPNTLPSTRPHGDAGFIVHPTWRVRGSDTEIHLYGRLQSGDTFLIIETREQPRFYVRDGEAAQARKSAARFGAKEARSGRRTMDGEEVVALALRRPTQMGPLRRALAESGVRTYEADVPFAWSTLLDRGLRGAVTISGSWSRGKHIDRIYRNPTVVGSDHTLSLTVASLALDIAPDGRVQAAALAATGTEESTTGQYSLAVRGYGTPDRDSEGVSSERDLLVRLREALCSLDPDLIVGWGIVPEILVPLKARFDACEVPFNLGRSDRLSRAVVQTPRSKGWWRGRSQGIIEGRQVLDALTMVWSGPQRFADLELNTVAECVLGMAPGTVLEQARAVLDILAADDLLRLTVQRSRLIGIPLQRAWTSVQAFDFLYLSELHARGMVAPTRDVDRLGGRPAPGGLILEPTPGTARNVLVLDFKSLYPSVIRTFNIDPATHVADPAGAEDLIHAPNTAAFTRSPGILPQILDRFFEQRAAAKERGDAVAAYAFKIIMNSFYGVLGTSSCRFASQLLSGAITSFGQHILRWTRDLLEGEGLTVLYGDTDSLFVDAGLPADSPPADALATGQRLARQVNERLAEYVETAYGVRSRLELEMEKVYARFFLPTVRGEERGRAKGYAGLVTGPDGDIVDVVGMEAVRRDWTALARRFQRELLDLAFHDASAKSVEAHVLETIRALRSGTLDSELVYQKSLRKPLDEYTKAQPPHVQAAALLPVPKVPGEPIRYVITLQGPRPIERIDAPLDYNHIVQKQLLPIARTLAPLLDIDESLFGNGQMALF